MPFKPTGRFCGSKGKNEHVIFRNGSTQNLLKNMNEDVTR